MATAISSPRILLVDDDEMIRETVKEVLGSQGFDVTGAASVNEALRLIVSDSFDALVTDLHMPEAADGFTVISAMRHSHPEAVTVLLSGHPDVQKAMSTLLLQADEILVKPVEVRELAESLRIRLGTRVKQVSVQKQRIHSILARSKESIVQHWLKLSKENPLLSHLTLPDDQRSGHLSKMIDDLSVRLEKSGFSFSALGRAASDHGKLRASQGYTPTMLVEESRLLQVTIFGELQRNFSYLDFSLVLPDVMKIADEVDSQLARTMTSFLGDSTN